MRRVWIVLSLSACTQANPLFGDRPGGTSDAGTSATGETTSTPPGDTSITTTASNDTTSITTDPEPSGDSTVDDSVGTETGEVCALPEGTGLTIEISNVPPPPSCAEVWMSPQGPLLREENNITVGACGCACEEVRPDFTIAIDGVEIGPLPGCGYILAWPKWVDDTCVWGGIAAFNGSQPAWLAGSTLGAPPEVFGGLEISLKQDESCESIECVDAGTYAIVFENTDGDNAIKMGEDPKVMTLPFYAALPYLVDNVSAVIDRMCGHHVAWTATYVQ